MLSRCILVLFVVCSNLCAAHTFDSTALRKARLINEIRQSDRVESYYLGCAGTKSNLCLKVDSLFDVCSFNEILTFYNDTSFVLKYYAYQFIAVENDSLAFQKLKTNIKDSILVFTQMTCMWGVEKFNELLVQEYASSINFKYYNGGVVMRNHKLYCNGKPNKKMWRKKRNELVLLLKENNIDSKPFKDLLHLTK